MNEDIPKWKLAFEDYKKGCKYKEIAEKYGVSISAVKSWKSRYWANKKLQPKYKKDATKNTQSRNQIRGGPLGNKHAVGNRGGSAPKGNKNNLKHGIYSLLNPNTLTENEKEAILSAQELDSIKELEEQVKLCDILISRALNEIARLKESNQLVPEMVTEKVITTTGKISKYNQEETEKTYISIEEKISRLNDAIAKQMKIKSGLLKELENIKINRARYKLEESENMQVIILNDIS